MPWYPAEIEPLRAVLAATVDSDGVLLEANTGFRRLLESLQTPLRPGEIVSRVFIQPKFTTLVGIRGDCDGEIFRGVATLGDFMGHSRSVLAVIRRDAGQLRLLAEYDADELERLYESLLELNQEYAKRQLELAQANLRLRQGEAAIVALSLTDNLTGVGNRRLLEQALEVEITRAERTGKPLCALMADLDHFKRVNDAYGHEAGDKVLAVFGNLLRHGTRPTDIVARFGGEEFMMLMPHTTLKDAAAIAERLREALTSATIGSVGEPVTVSIAVAEREPGERREELLQRVDHSLYEAKRAGCNQVVLAAHAPSGPESAARGLSPARA